MKTYGSKKEPCVTGGTHAFSRHDHETCLYSKSKINIQLDKEQSLQRHASKNEEDHFSLVNTMKKESARNLHTLKSVKQRHSSSSYICKQQLTNGNSDKKQGGRVQQNQ